MFLKNFLFTSMSPTLIPAQIECLSGNIHRNSGTLSIQGLCLHLPWVSPISVCSSLGEKSLCSGLFLHPWPCSAYSFNVSSSRFTAVVCGGFLASLDRMTGGKWHKSASTCIQAGSCLAFCTPNSTPCLSFIEEGSGYWSDMDCVMFMIIVKMLNILQFIP